jgi:hypothetical protein
MRSSESGGPEADGTASAQTVPDDGTVDFDLHGLVRIRLVGGGPREVAAVTRQLGPIQAPVEGKADLTIRFVDEIATRGRVRVVGLDQGGFTDDAFLILRSKHKSRARVQVPLDRIGDACEILCERGVNAVPQLIPIVNLTVLAKGALPLHASAFVWEGTGIAACGWSKGGKTETLLAFMRKGARYVGDEWVYVTGDGRWLHGIPEPVRLWDWHLRQLPEYRKHVRPRDRVKLGAIGAADRVHRGLPRSARRRLPGMHGFDRVMTLLEGQRHVDPAPERLFGRDRWVERAAFDRLVFLQNAEIDRVTVEPVDPLEVAERMTFSHVHHRLGFLDYYWQFRFAFPDRANPLIDDIERVERELLQRVFEGKRAYRVEHPHPVPIPSLFDAIAPHCD